MRDWKMIREQFIHDGLSLDEICISHRLSSSVLYRRAMDEGWRERRLEYLRRDNSERLERLTGKLLGSIEERLDSESSIEIKDYKSVSGALKEIREMQKSDAPRELLPREEGLKVRFLGEAEELSR